MYVAGLRLANVEDMFGMILKQVQNWPRQINNRHDITPSVHILVGGTTCVNLYKTCKAVERKLVKKRAHMLGDPTLDNGVWSLRYRPKTNQPFLSFPLPF